jgi:5S rRNA maturation endonuclease (ribonuclease M5)
MATVKNAPAAQLVLYRLPELLAADPAVQVHLGEGEKDVDRLRALGLTATCNPMGAGTWRPEYNSNLQGRAVVILPDHDDPGRAHAQKVARSLHGIAASIKIVELPKLPEKGDISDWLDAGGTVEQLQALVEAASEFDPATAPAPGTKTIAAKGAKSGDGDEEPTQQEILLSIAAAAELFHTSDDESFARIPVNGHLETWAVRGGGFKKWLLHGFYKLQGKAPQSEIFSSTIKLLEAKALFGGPEQRVWVRLAESEGAIYLDLGNEQWEAVKVTNAGWEVVADAPVCFRRPRSMLPLPYPERGGNINELRPFVNVATVQDFRLMVAYQLAAMRPRGPYPIMVLTGEQGSAKSTAARVNRSLVDPNTSPLRSAPREERDLMISATNSWMLVFDNLSGIPPWLSDSFCRLSTGGGISNRELYTNGEEFILDAMRPVLLNGIDSLTERADLADRALIFNLLQIPKENRQSEKKFWADFEKVWPRILGALLDAVSMGLRNQSSVELPALPRMADFAIWVVACEPALPWPPGSFMGAYAGNRQEAVELSLEADVVATAVRAHMADREEWLGTPSELHEVLKEHISETTQKSKVWPKAPNKLSGRLKRAATFLRAVGIHVEIGWGKNKGREVVLRRVAQGRESTVGTVGTVKNKETQGFSSHGTEFSHGTEGPSHDTEKEPWDRKGNNHTGSHDTHGSHATLPTSGNGDVEEFEL